MCSKYPPKIIRISTKVLSKTRLQKHHILIPKYSNMPPTWSAPKRSGNLQSGHGHKDKHLRSRVFEFRQFQKTNRWAHKIKESQFRADLIFQVHHKTNLQVANPQDQRQIFARWHSHVRTKSVWHSPSTRSKSLVNSVPILSVAWRHMYIWAHLWNQKSKWARRSKSVPSWKQRSKSLMSLWRSTCRWHTRGIKDQRVFDLICGGCRSILVKEPSEDQGAIRRWMNHQSHHYVPIQPINA